MHHHRMVKCKVAFLLPLTVSLAASLVRVASAQQDPCLDRSIAINVLTEKGESVEGLSEQKVRAEVQHQPVQIVSLKRDTAPRRIVIAIDTSGSMTRQSQWGNAMWAASEMFSIAPPDTSFALVTFTTHVEDEIDFARGRAIVAKELLNLRRIDWEKYRNIPRKSALMEMLVEALSLFGTPVSGDMVFVITDGGDNASRIPISEVQSKFLFAGVRLFCFFVSAHAWEPMAPAGAPRPEDLAKLVQVTGGDVAEDQLSYHGGVLHWENMVGKRGLTLLAGEMTDSWRVGFRLPQPLDKERDINLQVADESGKRNSHLRVIYPQRLAPCR